MRRGAAPWIALGCGWSVSACGGAAVEAPQPRLEALPSAAPQEPAVEAREAPPGELGEELERTLEVVSQVRGLAAKGRVRGEVISRGEMIDRLGRGLREDIPPEVLAAEVELLFALGTVPADFDYEQSLLGMMEEQLAGFYEPDDRTLYVMEDLRGAERFATLAHELVHALQDQHFGLAGKLDYRVDANDEQSALHSLAEGDATSAMLDVMQGRPAHEMSEVTLGLLLRAGAVFGSEGRVPGIVQRSVMAPYADGVGAVHWARRRGGWAGVDGLWTRPPRTTEQLLHPEKWLTDEPAIDVAIPSPDPGGPQRLVFHDVEGEQGLRVLLEEWVPRGKAVSSAAGWGGDRIAVFSEGERHAVAWRVVFDTVSAAEQAGLTLARGVLAQDPAVPRVEGIVAEATAKAVWGSRELCRERPLAGPLAVVQQGQGVGVVAGPYRRREGVPASASSCGGAIAWARAVAAGR